MNNSPCLRCTRVKNPRGCENKECQVWRNWFVSRWDRMRLQTRLQREKLPDEKEGVNIGGITYALPHRVHSYLNNDPCEKCLCPKDLCMLPCKQKRNWIKAKEDVFLN